jgi:ATP-dependent DNA helicase RecG
MKIHKNINYLFEKVSTLKGVGKKLSSYLKNKKIDKINDLIWNLPYSYTDRRNIVTLEKLEVGKISTIKVKVKKYNFPRIRNLPNKITCEDEVGQIDIIFFNSREGYIRKILPLNEWVIISGKINYFRNSYQITNPDYITSIENKDYVQKLIPKYSLTEGLNEKSYRKIIDQVLINLPNVNEWHTKLFLKEMNFPSWENAILNLHKEGSAKDINSHFYRRLAYDEILSHLLALSENIKRIKRNKK